MNDFAWLHLTDLHFGHKAHEPLWPTIRQAFFEDVIKLHQKCGPWNTIIFSGDMTNRGTKEEFDHMQSELISPLMEVLEGIGSKDVILLSVPGNHDVVRSSGKTKPAALRQLTRANGFAEIADEFWCEPDSEYRQFVEKSFANYDEWNRRVNKHADVVLNKGILPGDFSASIALAPKNGTQTKIGVVGLNTTFLQLDSGDFEGRLVWSERQLHEVCDKNAPGWIDDKDACILVTHQGPSWMDPVYCKSVYPEINPAGRFAVHLFGHMHESELTALSISGGNARRCCQARSLFGLEQYVGKAGIQIDRRHGYCAGRIVFDGAGPGIRFWPRTAHKNENGWQFSPDYEKGALEDDQGTPRESIAPKRQKLYSSKAKSSVAATALEAVASVGETIDSEDLNAYRIAIHNAHCNISFAEVPLQKELSDIPLERLYVGPKLSGSEIHGDIDEAAWPACSDVLQVMEKSREIIVLGDPGSGKSTLISSIAWQLCRPLSKADVEWRNALGRCVPIPIILRELNIKSDITWESLLDAFLSNRSGKQMPGRARLDQILKSGAAMVLVDGLDEISNIVVRSKVRDAIHEGMTLHNGCRWLLTSRIVGYGKAPFHHKLETIDSANDRAGNKFQVERKMAELYYLTPFSNLQIRQFSLNWFSQYESNQESRIQLVKEFVEAIKANEGTNRLGRIPYLLTLMALIYHKNAALPHGRTELYERIATAYLEQIDLRRKLYELPYSLAQTKRWLGEVAYRMQLRRASKKATRSEGSRIIASQAAVKKWLRTAMAASSIRDSGIEADRLIEYFASRSGLLLPRGAGLFAFMHLSLQEYFAACFIEPRLATSRFSASEEKADPSDDQLWEWANQEAWRESFVLLFELISQKSASHTEGFLNYLFDGRLEGDSNGSESISADLLAEIATDPFVQLSASLRNKCIQKCWRWEFRQSRDLFPGRYFVPQLSNVVRSLVRFSGGDLKAAWKAGGISRSELDQVTTLNFSDCASLKDLEPLAELPKLENLNLRNCRSVVDWSCLSKLKNLKVLNLEGCDVSMHFEAIRQCRNLRGLILGSPVPMESLSSLTSLKELHLHFESRQQVDVSALIYLEELEFLCAGESWIHVKREIELEPEKIKSNGVRRWLGQEKSVSSRQSSSSEYDIEHIRTPNNP